jgi:RNA polymerase sigma-70 factor, ECF subfamily
VSETVQERQLDLTDGEVIARVLAGETPLYEILMRRYNQRIYRAARAILRDDTEAEDVMQDAYLRAYRNLAKFEGRSSFATWLTRIAVNEALHRRKKESRTETIEGEDHIMELAALGDSPEQSYGRQEITGILEQAIGALPEQYRAVVMLRDVEEMDTEEVAEALDISAENVRVRLHRARALLKRYLSEKVGLASRYAYTFDLRRCDRVVAGVFARIRSEVASAVDG